MEGFVRPLLAASVSLVVVGCSSANSPSVVTETVTATSVSEATTGPESQQAAAPTTPVTSAAQLRTMVEDAVADSDLDLTAPLCDDWVNRRDEIVESMTDVILKRLDPLRPADPEEIRRISADAIRDHVDRECAVVVDDGELTKDGSMAAAAELDDCNEPWDTTDHVGNSFTVTLCGTPDDEAVSLYEFDRSQYSGMVREYTETTYVTPTWAVAASTNALLDEVVERLEVARWPSPADASRSGEPSPEDRAETPEPETGTSRWDVTDGDYYATVKGCRLDQQGNPVASVTVQNDSSTAADILGMVEILDTASGELHSFALYQAYDVPPGKSKKTEAVGHEGVPSEYICAAYTVGAMD